MNRFLALSSLASFASLTLVAGCAADHAVDEAGSSAQDISANVTSAYTEVGRQSPLDACNETQGPGGEGEDAGPIAFGCAGMGDYSLGALLHSEHGEFPTVTTKTGTYDLDVDTALQSANINGYATLNGYIGKLAEWRGRGLSSATPDAPYSGKVDASALILRYFFYDENTAGTFKDTNAMLVVKLAPTGACIYSAVSGQTPNHNQAARDIADSAAFANFTCPNALPHPLAPSACGKLAPNQGLEVGGSVSSCSGSHTLVLQDDGNVVLYNNSKHKATWSSQTVGAPVQAAIMRQNGQFGAFAYDLDAAFITPETNSADAWLAVQDDGNVVIYSQAGAALWSTRTNGK